MDACGGGGGGGADAAPLSTALLALLRALDPGDASGAGGRRRSLSPQPVLHPLRSQLPAAALRRGQEHDAAEALELLLQALSTELRHAFKCRAGYPRLVASATLNSVLSRPAGGDAVLQGWQAVRLASEVRWPRVHPCAEVAACQFIGALGPHFCGALIAAAGAGCVGHALPALHPALCCAARPLQRAAAGRAHCAEARQRAARLPARRAGRCAGRLPGGVPRV